MKKKQNLVFHHFIFSVEVFLFCFLNQKELFHKEEYNFFYAMHLFALDSTGKLTSAKEAAKQQDYICLECNGPVRRRSGIHRTPHYFHLNPSEFCRQQGKSLVHLQVQHFLQALLPPGEVQLEYFFPAVKRIADVAWLPQGIIFEVQCSFITPEEISERQKDYKSQGFYVVWILHDRRFNQWRLSAAEDFLQSFPHYFTNIDSDGKGVIYDQLPIIKKGIRQKKLKGLSPHLNKPLVVKEIQLDFVIPFTLKNRLTNWPIYFEGDWIFKVIHNNKDLLFDTEDLIIEYSLSFKQIFLNLCYFCFYRPYDLVFKFLLEKACK